MRAPARRHASTTVARRVDGEGNADVAHSRDRGRGAAQLEVERHLWMTGARRRGPDVKDISTVGDHALAERADGPEVVAEAVARAGIVGRVDDAHDQGALADRKDRPRTLGLRGIAR